MVVCDQTEANACVAYLGQALVEDVSAISPPTDLRRVRGKSRGFSQECPFVGVEQQAPGLVRLR